MAGKSRPREGHREPLLSIPIQRAFAKTQRLAASPEGPSVQVWKGASSPGRHSPESAAGPGGQCSGEGPGRGLVPANDAVVVTGAADFSDRGLSPGPPRTSNVILNHPFVFHYPSVLIPKLYSVSRTGLSWVGSRRLSSGACHTASACQHCFLMQGLEPPSETLVTDSVPSWQTFTCETSFL